jgi:hypothetical protein
MVQIGDDKGTGGKRRRLYSGTMPEFTEGTEEEQGKNTMINVSILTVRQSTLAHTTQVFA